MLTENAKRCIIILSICVFRINENNIDIDLLIEDRKGGHINELKG